jgi:hypothetical protein
MIGPGAQVGDAVVNTRTKLAYVVANVLPDGRYQLAYRSPDPENIFQREAPPVAAPDDAAYVLVPGARRMPSPTAQNLKARYEEITAAIDVRSDAVARLLRELVAREEARGPTEHVFYNAAGPGARALHRIGKMLIQCLHTVRGGTPPQLESFEFLRLPAPSYDPRTLLRPRDFLAEVLGGPGVWSDHDRARPVLSTQLSGFGDIRAGGSENSFTIFLHGGLFDVDVAKARGLLMGLLESYRAPRSLCELVGPLLGRALDLLGRKPCGSAIYQIYLDESVLDELAYISIQSGHPLDSKLGKLYGLKDTADVATGTSHPARSSAFTHAVATGARTEGYWRAFAGGNDPQARLIMNPNYFATPNSAVRICVFEREQTEADLVLRNLGRDLLDACMTWVATAEREVRVFATEHAVALARLDITLAPGPADLSASILCDYVNTLPKLLDLMTERGLSAFDFMNV